MREDQIKTAVRKLKKADGRERLEVFRDASARLDPKRPEKYEPIATALAMCRRDTADFALRAIGDGGALDRETRFLIFATGAIFSRRELDKRCSDELFRLCDGEFADIPLFKHFHALSFDGGKRPELKRGLELEREFLDQVSSLPGAFNQVARFTLQLRESGDRSIGKEQLEAALDAIHEAIGLQEDYAKFFATRAAVHRQLGRFDEARDDLLDAIRLEDRSAVDARERIGDYRRELGFVDVSRTLADVDRKVAGLEARSQGTIERLRNAEISVITAVGFLAAALALVQVTLANIADRPLGESIAIVATFGAILFGAVALGSWLIRRPWKSLDPNTADTHARDGE